MATFSRRTPTPTRTLATAYPSPSKSNRNTVLQQSPPVSPHFQQKELGPDPRKVLRSQATNRASPVGEPASDYSENDHPHAYPEDHDDPSDTVEQFPHASMVESMVIALDQLSSAPANTQTYEDDLRNHRDRGYTSSSTLSSEIEPRGLPAQITVTAPPHGGSVRYAKDPNKLPSIFNENEDPARVKVYDAQRAMQPKNKIKKRSKDSGSSVDLGHLRQFANRLGPAGNRRSQSFDFGSKRPQPIEVDQSPAPAVYAAQDVQNAPMSPNFRTMPARRNSTRSVKDAQVRGKSATISAGNTNAANVSHASAYQAQNALGASVKPAPADVSYPPTSRPGLFKRFFGGSSRNLQASPAPATPQAQAIERTSRDIASGNKENTTTTPQGASKLQKGHAHKPSQDAGIDVRPPLNTKKSTSSFFRRRKKSISTATPPPIPLTLGQAVGEDPKPGEPSPVSSLKAFMDPFLGTEQAAKEPKTPKTPNSPLATFYTATDNSAGTGITPADQDRSAAGSRTRGRLEVPHKETFLVDSSSTEDMQSEYGEHKPVRPPASTRSESKSSLNSVSYVIGKKTSNGVINPTGRPVLDTRSTSWQSQGERLVVPVRKQSLPPLETAPAAAAAAAAQSNLQMLHKNLSGSDVSEYRSAPSTPQVPETEQSLTSGKKSPTLHISHPSISQVQDSHEADKAARIYDNGDEEVEGQRAAAWLGEAGSDRERIRKAYMALYDFTSHNILSALRTLCSRLVLKAESQLIDRIIDAFAQQWCSCNPNHGFKSADVVHTICYSILLLNTDLHMADIGQKMTRSQFVKNAMHTIRTVIADSSADEPKSPNLLAVRSNSYGPSALERVSTDGNGRSMSSLGYRPHDRLIRSDSNDVELSLGTSGPLVDAPFNGSNAGWEMQIESVLKDFYYSIQKEPLPRFGSEQPARSYGPSASSNLLSLGGLRRTPSVISKQSETTRSRTAVDSRSLSSKWNAKSRSRPRIGSTPGFGSSKTSLEDQSSAWSPSMSSTWSKVSLGKTLTSMSVDSFNAESIRGGDYQSSIGFANALSQAIIREDQLDGQSDDGMKAAPLLEDESLELEGAPWAKEGIVKHKCHLEGVEKRSKDRNWNDCFAVIEKGWMRLFSFSMTAKSLRNKARTQKAGAVVGGGNWQDNAEEVWKFMLRHTIASSLPPPGYSKQRPHVWALSLPTGAVHLFSVGTPDIVKEFVSTANFWSARLSKEPMIGGVSSLEYGWSENVINKALINVEARPSVSTDVMRPSTQMSIRSSVDHGMSVRPKLPGDRVHISDWTPPQQSMLASQLMEVDQLRGLQTYVQNVEMDLQKHNELRGPMLLAFSSKHPNHSKAMSNWEKKSSYLLREIVKFKNYIDILQNAQAAKERIYKMRKEEEEHRMTMDESRAMNQTTLLA